MLRDVYMRPPERKRPCRRHLFPQAAINTDRQLLTPGTCLCHVAPWLSVELWRCSACGPGWVAREGRVFVCPVPTKATRESLVSSSGSSVKRSTTFDSFPELWAFLTSYKCPDGTGRQGGKLSLSCEQSVWTLALNDPTTSLYACLSSQDLDDLVLMAEARLAESTMPWRPSAYAPKGKKS